MERVSIQETALWLPSTAGGGLRGERLVATGGRGVWVDTERHGRLLDANSGLWHMSLGYGRTPAVDAAVRAMESLGGSSLFRRSHIYAETLAAQIRGQLGLEDDLVYFATSGSEAIDTTMRMAFAYGIDERRDTIAYVEGSYHGVSLGPLSFMGLDGYRNGCQPVVRAISLPGPRKFDEDPAGVARQVSEQLRSVPLAMVVVEPILGSGGIEALSEEYLTCLGSLCEELDAILVVDEVTTGCWRAGEFATALGSGRSPVRVLGKGITAGLMALSPVVVPAYVWQRILGDPRTERLPGTTHSGGPAACAAATAVIDHLAHPEHRTARAQTSAALRTGLESVVDDNPGWRLTGTGHMFGLTRRDAQAGVAKDFVENATQRALKASLLVHPLSTGTIPIMPPLVIGLQEVDFLIERIGETVSAS
jgi:beta-alanine--pyruvate transaminase